MSMIMEKNMEFTRTVPKEMFLEISFIQKSPAIRWGKLYYTYVQYLI